MKRLTIRKGIAVLSTILLASSISAACSSDKGNGNTATLPNPKSEVASKLDPVTLKLMFFGEPPAGMDAVLAEFEKQTKDTLNTKLNIEWSPLSDHKQKTKLKMAAGEEVDILFDAKFANLTPMVSQGAYIELDKYFNNDKYPGLKKNFSKELIDYNKIDGKLYTIPLYTLLGTVDGVYIRKDLREKYGMQPIQNYDDLQKYWNKVLESEKGMVPFGTDGSRGFYNMLATTTKADAVIGSSFGSGIHWNVSFSADHKRVLDVTTIGDSKDLYRSFPAPYNDPGNIYGRYKTFQEWNKYLEKDSISQKDKNGLLISGKAASVEGDQTGYNVLSAKLKATLPNASLEFFAYRDGVKDLKPGSIPTTYWANNSIVIPKTSKNPDRAMAFIDWIFQSKDNHDLFEYGVKGKDWESVGEDQYKPLSTYAFPGYELTNTPNMVRINSETDPTVLKYVTYLSKEDTYYPAMLPSFNFNTEPVKTEVAKVTPKYSDTTKLLGNGLLKDLDAEILKLNQDLKSLGLDKIRVELKNQIQDYLDKGGKF